MSINIDKYKYTLFSRSALQASASFTLNSVLLARANEQIYISVLLITNLPWDCYIYSVVRSANRSLGYLRRNFRCSPSKLKRLFYIYLVRSKLENVSSNGNRHLSSLTDRMESVQSRAVRFIYYA